MQKLLLVILIFLGILFWFRRTLEREWSAFRTDQKRWWGRMWREWGEPLLMAAVIAIAIRTFVVGPYKIPTGSMRPTLIEGDRIFVDKWSYHFRLP